MAIDEKWEKPSWYPDEDVKATKQGWVYTKNNDEVLSSIPNLDDKQKTIEKYRTWDFSCGIGVPPQEFLNVGNVLGGTFTDQNEQGIWLNDAVPFKVVKIYNEFQIFNVNNFTEYYYEGRGRMIKPNNLEMFNGQFETRLYIVAEYKNVQKESSMSLSEMAQA